MNVWEQRASLLAELRAANVEFVLDKLGGLLYRFAGDYPCAEPSDWREFAVVECKLELTEALRAEKGVCVGCGLAPAAQGHKWCEECVSANRDHAWLTARINWAVAGAPRDPLPPAPVYVRKSLRTRLGPKAARNAEVGASLYEENEVTSGK